MQRVIERMLNLLAFLLTVGRPVSADEIRNTVAGYDQETDEAFRRTFERDKELLKSLGVPLKLEYTDAWQVEQGYVVSPEEYAFDAPDLTDEERTALWLASRIARLGGTAEGTTAIFKLGGASMSASGEPLAADLESDPQALSTLFTAVVEKQRVEFEYRGKERRVAPYGLVHRMGHWYLVGGVGDETRTFRIDRMSRPATVGKPDAFSRPSGMRPGDMVPTEPWEAGEETVTAVVQFDGEIAWWARRQAGRRAEIEELEDGTLRVRMPVASRDAFVGWVLGFEDAAVILEPDDLRAHLIEHVRSR
jgi:proteasome accessory factor B